MRLCPLNLLAAFALASCSNSKPQAGAPAPVAAPADAADEADDGGEDDGAQESGDCKATSDTVRVGNQTIKTANIQFKGFGGSVFSTEYNVIVTGTLKLEAAGRELAMTTGFDIVSADPPNARDKADEQIRKISGSRKVKALAKESRDRLGAEWQDVLCAVFPVEQLEETTGAHTTVIEFDPPLPYLASSKLSKAAFERALPSPVTFSGIKAKVVSTTNPKLSAGDTKSGTVTISPIDPTKAIEDNAGEKIDVEATYAYRVQFDFGDAEATGALGLQKSSFYYVKDGKMVAVSVETGVSDAPTVHFFP